eukprot:TRINITY_DN4514_c0_g1_i1.p1 TRINITY_DN4514_c0_g1~~TRINITY_DN4514_c0_g1_i1.p1  ORF type:complete len:286 (-),score=26.21 TRINITY_DN4514_c0_g1_i1:462-1319(-)
MNFLKIKPLLILFGMCIVLIGVGIIKYLRMSLIDIITIMVGVSLTPLLVDFINSFFPSVKRIVNLGASSILIGVIYTLISVALYYYLFLVIPYYFVYYNDGVIKGVETMKDYYNIIDNVDNSFRLLLSTVNNNFFCFLLLIFTLYIWTNVIYCYSCTILKSPTSRAQKSSEDRKEFYNENNPELNFEELTKNKRWCKRCLIIKTDKIHHCSICDVCLEMDHHCPMTGNCVSTGKDGNFIYFLLFITYVSLGNLWIVVTTFHPFYTCFLSQEFSNRCIVVGGNYQI